MNARDDARAFFPRGLTQPGKGYRFSLDPLLLAAFVRPKKRARLLDLGAGCGVAGLAALLLHPGKGCSALGVDLDPAQVEAAGRNALGLGLGQAYRAQVMDLRLIRRDLPPESFDLVLANPPYRAPGTGLVCRDPGRTGARFEITAALEDFPQAAAFALANRGAFGMVFPAARLPELFSACLAARLTPKRLRLVYSRGEEKARLLLVEAVKNAGRELVVEPPLVLYEGEGEATRLTAQAREFCPFLGAGR